MRTLDAALLRALRNSSVHLPAGELATLLHASREDVTSGVDDLRAAGFDIEDRPGFGYRLLANPDRLIADDLRSRLAPSSPLVRDILVFEETDSTNTRAAHLGEAGALGGLVIFAEHQTTGRGRFGRRWESSSHRGLWFSLLLRPTLPLAHWPRLTTWSAVAMADAIEQSTGLAVQIKWPNDLHSRGKKFGGILIETATDRAGSHFAVVGIGINVNHTAEDFPEALTGIATSLHLETRRTIDRPALASAILLSAAQWYEHLDGSFETLIAAARRRSSLLGKPVAIQAAQSRIEGLALDLDADGRLLVELRDGRVEAVGAGEATVLKE